MARRRPLIYINSGFGHFSSIDLDGSTEVIRNASETDLGIGSNWTTMIWHKHSSSLGGNNSLMVLQQAAGINNFIEMLTPTGIGLRVRIGNSAATTIKFYTYNTWFDQVNLGLWQQTVATWDGTTLQLYRNSVAKTPDTITTDLAGSMTNTNRKCAIGCSTAGAGLMAGLYHSFALWNRALSAAEVAATYNGGDGAAKDLLTVQRNSLVQWILLGTPSPFYSNLVGSLTLPDQTNIDATDIAHDAPQGN